jgi:hypothetical protein
MRKSYGCVTLLLDDLADWRDTDNSKTLEL